MINTGYREVDGICTLEIRQGPTDLLGRKTETEHAIQEANKIARSTVLDAYVTIINRLLQAQGYSEEGAVLAFNAFLPGFQPLWVDELRQRFLEPESGWESMKLSPLGEDVWSVKMWGLYPEEEE